MLILTVLPLKRGECPLELNGGGTKHWRIGAFATNETLNIVEASPISNGLNREDSCCSAAFGLTVTNQSKNQKRSSQFFDMFWFWDVWNVWNAWHVWKLGAILSIDLFVFFFLFSAWLHTRIWEDPGDGPSCVHWWIRQRCLGWF